MKETKPEKIITNNGGIIKISNLVERNSNDFEAVLKCCYHFANKGFIVEILPKIHFKNEKYKTFFGGLIGTKYEGKCPDFKVGNKYFELEGFDENSKPENRLKHMLQRGLKQAQNLVIQDDKSTPNHVKRLVFDRISNGVKVEEIYILRESGNIDLVYKNENP